MFLSKPIIKAVVASNKLTFSHKLHSGKFAAIFDNNDLMHGAYDISLACSYFWQFGTEVSSEIEKLCQAFLSSAFVFCVKSCFELKLIKIRSPPFIDSLNFFTLLF